jgi:hypothetical protein
MRTRPFEIGVVFKRPSLGAILVIIAKIVNPAALAEQHEVMANKKAAKEAANEAQGGMAAAAQAQSSADQAKASGNQADAEAQTATAVGVADAAAVSMLNKRGVGVG